MNYGTTTITPQKPIEYFDRLRVTGRDGEFRYEYKVDLDSSMGRYDLAMYRRNEHLNGNTTEIVLRTK
jgi:hypothetical protein